MFLSDLDTKSIIYIPRFGDLLLSFFLFRFLHAYPKGNKVDYLSLYLEVADSESLPSGWRKYVKFRLSIVKQNLKSDTELQGDSHFSDQSANNLINYF